MITAVLYRSDGLYTGYRSKGHSGYAQAGSDIICAGISILETTCVNSMESLLGVRIAPDVNEEKGLMSFDLPALEGPQAEGAQLLMGALGQGCSDLQEAYPGFVKFEIKERRKSP
ncbi:MAG: ribosomal-processing cysteine protease Prp [Clostridia bacterium]|nr:ribosomal-processing cysteine protease Prp [Clostridia bacterium]